MRYRAVAFDIDGTLVEPTSSWRYLHQRLGRWDVLSCRYHERFLAGEIDYRTFCEYDARHWKGLADSFVRSVFAEVPYRKHVVQMAWRLRNAGLRLIGVSTGLQYIGDRLKTELGFERVVSNRLVVKDGVLTGSVDIRAEYGGKGKVLARLLAEMGLAPRRR